MYVIEDDYIDIIKIYRNREDLFFPGLNRDPKIAVS